VVGSRSRGFGSFDGSGNVVCDRSEVPRDGIAEKESFHQAHLNVAMFMYNL
jgi:hypothetical protein